MIKVIVFDIGNVLMHFDWQPYIRRLFNNNQELIAGVEEGIWHTGLWNELDRNVMPEAEILAGMKQHNPKYTQEVTLALEHVQECISKADYAVPWVQELKAAGYTVYFLSNYSHFTRNMRPDVLDFLHYMDGGVFSYEVQLVKPDPKIYATIEAKYQLVPAETVFLDDNLANVEAARARGWQAIHVQEHEQAYRDLQQLLAR